MAKVRKIAKCLVCGRVNTFVKSKVGEVCAVCEPRTKTVVINPKEEIEEEIEE